MTCRPKNRSYYRSRAIDCETAAFDEATTEAEQAILLHCAARWHRLANGLSLPDPEGRHDPSLRASAGG